MTTTSTELTPEQVANDAAFKDRLGGITFAMYRSFPFFALLAESFTIRKSRHIPTACVDNHGNISFNPDFVAQLSDINFIFVLAHEVMHPAFDYFGRMGSRHPDLWNCAHDFAINLMLRDSFGRKDALPKGVLISDKYADMTAEQIYESLFRNAKKSKDFLNMLSGDTVMSDCDGEGKGDVVRQNRAKRPSSIEEWHSAVASAATRAKQMGKLPESIEREVGILLQSKVDWAEQLRQYLRHGVSRIQRDMYTFTPPSRRFIHQDIYLPSMVGYDAPKIAFAIDTSGSMGNAEIGQAHAEIDAIRKQFGCHVYVMSCDADVGSGEWIDPYSELPMPVGGGGTDFRPVFKHLKNERIPVDVVVYLTDGYGEFGEDPDIQTIWVMTTHESPPWGQHVQIGVDA
jgi:predicted metal-dependent peptidase